MVNATFYTWDKEFNSTARPPAGTGVALECEFKTPFSILNPTIILIFDGDPHVWNFVHIADLGRYYIINDWSYDRGRWFAACAVDVLASWKTAIANTSQYVVRAASRYNGALVDVLYPTTAEIQHSARYFTEGSPFTASYTSGSIVLGIVNDAAGSIGGINYYKMSMAQLNAFMQALLSDIDWMGISGDEISTGLQKALSNPTEYIDSVRWYPFNVSATSSDGLHYGWWDFPTIRAAKIGNFDISLTRGHLTPPKHPQSTERGEYLNLTPYTDYTLIAPPFGTFPLNPSMMANCGQLVHDISVDVRTGEAVLSVYAKPSAEDPLLEPYEIIRARTTVGVPIQIAMIAREFSKTGGAGAGLSAFWNAALTPEARDLFGVGNSPGAIGSTLSTSGQTGSFVDFLGANATWRLNSTFCIVADDEPARFGRPLMEVVTLSTLSGYIQCSSPHIDGVDCTGAERQMLHDHLASGFYLV